MLKIRQERPTSRHWEAIEDLQFQLISLDLFVTHWDVSQAELARLADAPINTVKKWFCKSCHRSPDFEHLYRLTVIHRRWLEVKSQW